MKQDWKSGLIEQICNVEYGTRVVRKRDAGSIYPTYGGGGATFFMDSYNRENKLIIARFAMSEVCTRFVSGKFFLNDSGLTISPKDGIELYEPFLNYQMLAMNDIIYSHGRGTAQKNLNVDAFKKLEVFYPTDIEVQKRIVAKLDQCFESIDKARANVEKNLQNAKDLFQSQLNEIFSQKGDGWETSQWSDILEIQSGRNQKEVLDPNGLFPILGSAGKVMGYANDYICDSGTTIIGRKGTIDKPLYIETKFWNVDTAFGLVAGKLIEKKFLYYFCLSYDFKSLDKGTTLPSLVKKDLIKISMSFPDKNQQLKIISLLDNLQSKSNDLQFNYQQELDALDELKKSILEKAFNGEL